MPRSQRARRTRWKFCSSRTETGCLGGGFHTRWAARSIASHRFPRASASCNDVGSLSHGRDADFPLGTTTTFLPLRRFDFDGDRNGQAAVASRDDLKYTGRILAYDHKHRHVSYKGTLYEFRDAHQLLADFFADVDRVLREVKER